MHAPHSPTARAPVVIAVKEEALAVSLELVVQIFELGVLIHDPETGLGGLPLDRDSTLIIDRELLPRDPKGFFRQLRAQLWRGVAIVLTEDKDSPAAVLGPIDGLILLEKPFGSRELFETIRPIHGRRSSDRAVAPSSQLAG